MISLPSLSSVAPSLLSDRPLLRRGLYTVVALLALWGLVQTRALVAPSTASPSDEAVANQSTVTPSDASGPALFTWGNASAVLLLIGGGAVALYLHRRESGPSGPTPLRAVGRLSVGQQELSLVACGDEVLLLGVTDEDVTLLKTYSPEAFDEEITDGPSQERAAHGALYDRNGTSEDFAALLRRFN